MMKATPKFVVPETLEELQARVLAEDPPCTCDKCDPGSYKCKALHNTIDVCQREENRFGTACIPPHLLEFDVWRTYESRNLAYRCVEYFDRDFDQLNELQIKAVNRFHRYWNTWGHRLNWTDGPRAVGKGDMEKLLQVINDLFFFGDIPKMEFGWAKADTEGFGDRTLAQCKTNAKRRTIVIRMHPTEYDSGSWAHHAQGIQLDRLGSLFHEAEHAYLETHSCRRCPRFRDNLDSEGHGMAFSLIAARLDVAVSRLLGPCIRLDRLWVMRAHMTVTKKLPSRCNLVECDLLPTS